ncbi:serine threonine-protein phosphatase 4 regulatory subunit 2, putative [Ichthyophthirius multifiliis]|uniref:Serine threonine-protein phosphatase 4 regulatory subunit 2, putative n=1 Tax=Ichthyophthirius multifiliis TaxID=5932 RepID=G0QZT6_ICHMU|nr:serine threonine-protein phosphatase 4 regulatory subunit 2, putative [Ichthyophthirius multifiliis]EGR29274.1 serine threonine-protein phosphatase 4 regulatory subunit 2, putative [Ichthyophthirius multifiliis]|eukprot:XP_004030510.1 serine threonine-protein phosphatase 4 regulatory subunit 2, putative [Ichthyophthirius multifiliis]
MDLQQEKLKLQLEQFHNLVEQEITQIQNGEKVTNHTPQTPEYQKLRNELEKVLIEISKTGEYQPFNWKHLRSHIIIVARDVLAQMNQQFPDMKQNLGESFEDELEVILQFISGFDSKPPFTLQRICELLLNPKQQYKSSKKILFALEKLVNVTPEEALLEIAIQHKIQLPILKWLLKQIYIILIIPKFLMKRNYQKYYKDKKGLQYYIGMELMILEKTQLQWISKELIQKLYFKNVKENLL